MEFILKDTPFAIRSAELSATIPDPYWLRKYHPTGDPRLFWSLEVTVEGELGGEVCAPLAAVEEMRFPIRQWVDVVGRTDQHGFHRELGRSRRCLTAGAAGREPATGTDMTSNKPSQDDENAPVEVVAYDPAWPAKFKEERAVLEGLLAPWIVADVEHVGSTAVPGLAAKPVIDIMVPVESLAASRGTIEAAGRAGYLYWPYKADVMHWFCKPSAAHRTHHLHVVPFESPLWFERLRFRDALRSDSGLAGRYAELKLQLAERYRHDREAYTEGKTDFVTAVLAGTAGR